MDLIEKHEFTKKTQFPTRRSSDILPRRSVNTVWHRSPEKIARRLAQACENSVEVTYCQTKIEGDFTSKEICWIKWW